MGLVFALIGSLLLISGIVGVWMGNWRQMWAAQAYMALFVIGCLTIDHWYQLAGINRGDGFVLIGIVMLGLVAAGISLAALAIAGIIHVIRGNRAATQVEGKSGAA